MHNEATSDCYSFRVDMEQEFEKDILLDVQMHNQNNVQVLVRFG